MPKITYHHSFIDAMQSAIDSETIGLSNKEVCNLLADLTSSDRRITPTSSELLDTEDPNGNNLKIVVSD